MVGHCSVRELWEMAGYQCSCGYQTGDRSHFNRHLGTCEVETRGGPREHSGRKPRVDDDDPPDLRDLKAFYKALDEMVDLRVCAVCESAPTLARRRCGM